jgi:hypothetical protein
MLLHFVSKEQYALKETPAFQQELKNLFDDFYQIPEGAANNLGTKTVPLYPQAPVTKIFMIF